MKIFLDSLILFRPSYQRKKSAEFNGRIIFQIQAKMQVLPENCFCGMDVLN